MQRYVLYNDDIYAALFNVSQSMLKHYSKNIDETDKVLLQELSQACQDNGYLQDAYQHGAVLLQR